MNSKKNNYFIGITNAIFMLSLYFEYFISNQFSINLLLENNLYYIFKRASFIAIGCINIICGIINKRSKNISFWQISFGILEIMYGINYIFIDQYSYNIWFFLYEFLPIIFVLLNIFKSIKYKKIKVIEVFCYVGIIIISVLEIKKIIDWYWYIWTIPTLIMQFIETHKQENFKHKKILSILFFYIIQSIFTIGFFILIIFTLFQINLKEKQINENIKRIYGELPQLEGYTTEEIYVPVRKNNKYGYINERGEEKISCQFDIVSNFVDTEIQNNYYNIALATIGEDVFIINKDNKKINVNKYMQNDERERLLKVQYNQFPDYNLLSSVDIEDIKIMSATGRLFKLLNTPIPSSEEKFESNPYDRGKYVALEKTITGYAYKFKDYVIDLDYIEGESHSTQKDYRESTILDENDMSEISIDKTKCKVTIKKNGEKISNIENIVGYSETDLENLTTLTDGYVEYESLDGKEHGFYDEKGNKYGINMKYTIMDIRDSNIILRRKTEEENQVTDYFIVDKNNKKIILKSPKIYLTKDLYIITDENNRVTLYNNNLKPISNSYDMIYVE